MFRILRAVTTTSPPARGVKPRRRSVKRHMLSRNLSRSTRWFAKTFRRTPRRPKMGATGSCRDSTRSSSAFDPVASSRHPWLTLERLCSEPSSFLFPTPQGPSSASRRKEGLDDAITWKEGRYRSAPESSSLLVFSDDRSQLPRSSLPSEASSGPSTTLSIDRLPESTSRQATTIGSSSSVLLGLGGLTLSEDGRGRHSLTAQASYTAAPGDVGSQPTSSLVTNPFVESLRCGGGDPVSSPANATRHLSQVQLGHGDVLVDDPARYTILRKLGQGGFGLVFLAQAHSSDADLDLPDYVAIKVFPKANLINPATRGALSAVRFDGTPFTARMISTFNCWERDIACIVMTLYCGDLYDILDRKHVMSPWQVRLYAAEIVIALRGLHNLGFVHHDLKAENILLDEQGHVALGDFGLAERPKIRFGGDFETGTVTNFRGTPGRFPPEQLWNSVRCTYKVDMWGLGLLLFDLHVGAGTKLYGDKGLHALKTRDIGTAVVLLVDDVDARDLIIRLLDRDPEMRPPMEDVMSHPYFDTMYVTRPQIPMFVR
ncbi:kinase-like domain-containing protein [Gloeopeniophorella convolvens]|nr:kinase-like domain-containing protein [Gloeopeniophorella convolvens]